MKSDIRNSNIGSIDDAPVRLSFPWLTWLMVVVGFLVLNWFTQPFEDAISLVPPAKPFYFDIVWYLDDIIGPSLFMTAGILFLCQAGLNRKLWPVIGLGLSCIAFGLGDTTDIHWVLPTGLSAGSEGISFSSWMSKVAAVIVFCYFVISAYDELVRPAQKAMIFAFTLLYIDQIQMSISLDFAGYSFHVFEESLEVVTSLFFCVGAACYKFRGNGASDRTRLPPADRRGGQGSDSTT